MLVISRISPVKCGLPKNNLQMLKFFFFKKKKSQYKLGGKIIVGGMKHNRWPGFVRPFVNREAALA